MHCTQNEELLPCVPCINQPFADPGGVGVLDTREAIRASYKGSLQTILTSATILIAAVGAISFAFYDPAIRQICRILSLGSLIATTLVIFVLPAILACLDRFIVKRNS